jgi:general secretion pathway protein A
VYESFYGLREKPFNLTPDPRFLYLSKKHKEAFAHLLYGIRNRSGFVEITGEIGTGKTTICRTLLDQAEPEVEIAFIFNPYLSATELLRAINEDFGIKSSAVTKKELIDELNAHLLERRKQGKNCVLLIDEAQNLSTPVLEQIRLLSNLETDTEKLLQIILVAQPELQEMLSSPELRQLNQRITARYHLKPLDYNEMIQYIWHRITKAGGRGKIRFASRALREIYKYSRGTPRLINAVCDRALLIGYTRETKRIDHAIIKRTIREIEGEKLKTRRKESPRAAPRRRAAASAIAAVCAVAIVALGAYYLFATGMFDKLPLKAAAPEPELNERPVVHTPVAPASEQPAQRFMDFVRSLDYGESHHDAALALAACWGTSQDQLSGPLHSGSIDFFEVASRAGLRCTAMRADLKKLTLIGLPCILEQYLPGEQRPVYVCLKNLRETDGLVLATVSKDINATEEFPFELLERYWFGRCFFFWREFENVPEILALSSLGDNVRWLQSQLQSAGTYTGDITGRYDEQTMQAVLDFQRKYRLEDDGIVGPNTRMMLYAALDAYDTPELVLEPASPQAGVQHELDS